MRIISVLSFLTFVPGAVEWDGEAPLAILAQRLAAEQVLLTTQVGERQDVRLAGGLHAVLNTATQASVYRSWGQQRVALSSGEMFFETAAGDSTPLRVAAGCIEIEATHAKFSIRRAVGGPCTLRVYNGEVFVYADGAAIQPGMRRGSIVAVKLAGGRTLVVWPDHATFSQFDPATAERLLSWLDGKLVFKGDLLADVIAEFNRYNRERIEIADDSIGQIRIGGRYAATNPERFAEDLRMFGIRALRAPAGEHGEIVIVLTKAPSPTKPQIRKPPNDEPSGRMPGEGARWPYKLRPREAVAAITV